MAAAAAGKNAAKCNIVADDLIWKDHCTKEIDTAKKWPENWGFLRDVHVELASTGKGNIGGGKLETTMRKEKLRLPRIDDEHAKTLGVGRPEKGFPRTTSNDIGWRSSQPQCKLERYGRYTKKMCSILTQLNWPPEAV